MRTSKPFENRQADQAQSKAKLAERLERIKNKARFKNPNPSAARAEALPQEEVDQHRRPWASVRMDGAHHDYESRTANARLRPQPWAAGLVNAVLESADLGTNSLLLVWPAAAPSLALLHALASIERLHARDLRSLRTLLWPGTHASASALGGTLASRKLLSDLYLSLWERQEDGQLEKVLRTSSPAFFAALEAINDIQFHHPELPNPSLAEIVPAFVFAPGAAQWTTTMTNPLERTIRKIDRLSNRRDLRQKVITEWGAPQLAPGALMVLHHAAKKESWKTALASEALRGSGHPEVLLLDATQAAMQTNFAAVQRIPNFLHFARQNGFGDCGAVVVTDDPKTYFVLRSQLTDLKIAFSTKVFVAEASEVLLSADPVPRDWKPAQRSNSNFRVSIVDRDASQLALSLQRLTASAGSEDSPGYQAILKACMYVLRLSNMPAGYRDLTEASVGAAERDFLSQQNAWTPVRLALMSALDSGALNEIRSAVERAIERCEKLIDDWNDATPMAARMLAEVSKHAVAGQHRISLVLPNNKYVLLAHRFLMRKLGDSWATTEARVEWHTLSGVAKTMSCGRRTSHFAFVGMNPDVLRILITHPEVPHGTAVLVAYRQAESTLRTLESMKEVEELKAYRGRMGLLIQELERRLAEVPNPIVIGKLREMTMTFKFDDGGQSGQSGEQTYYKFELEGGGRAYASGWVYRYAPDEDPPFRRAAASNIHSGDFIFDMSEELRAKVESSLNLNIEGLSSVVDPVRMLLKLYHDDVQRRCALMFRATKRSVLSREIHARMVEIDASAADCRPGRVYYWLDLQLKGDARPHAAKESKYFRIFCNALGITDEQAEQHWGFVRSARRLNQYLGRELVARYAEILFQPESAAAYRKVPEAVIKDLQHEALRCVYRVENVVPPPTS